MTTTWTAPERIVLDRAKQYPVVSRPGPAWRWTYTYQLNDGAPIAYGTSLAGLRDLLRRKHPHAQVAQTWAAR